MSVSEAFKQGFVDAMKKMAEDAGATPTDEELAARPIWKGVQYTKAPAWNRWIPWTTSWDKINRSENDFNSNVSRHNAPIYDAQKRVARKNFESALAGGDETAIGNASQEMYDKDLYGDDAGIGGLDFIDWNIMQNKNKNIGAGMNQPREYQANRAGWASSSRRPRYAADLVPSHMSSGHFTKNPAIWDSNAWAFTPAGTNLVHLLERGHRDGQVNWNLLDHQTGKNPNPFAMKRDADGKLVVEDRK